MAKKMAGPKGAGNKNVGHPPPPAQPGASAKQPANKAGGMPSAGKPPMQGPKK